MVDKGDGDGPLEDLTVHGIPLTIARLLTSLVRSSFPNQPQPIYDFDW